MHGSELRAERIKQGATRVTNAEDVIEVLGTTLRAALLEWQAVGREQRNLLPADGLSPTEEKI
jgi:predicted Rossmann fold nucleotide-binding protein DprA/Smf involved in DNA uptake